MSLPSPSLSVPALSNDQIGFQGVTLGAGTAFGLKRIEGLGKPDVRSGNTDRPRFPGQFVGFNALKARQITATIDVGPSGTNYGGYGSLAGSLGALRSALSTEGSTEYPLWIKLPGFSQVCCSARVIHAPINWDIVADLGGMAQNIPIQFEATDPYLYASPTVAPSVGLPTPGAGFKFNPYPSGITFPLSFGGGGTASTITAVNSGDVACWPVLVITGPCLNPTVQSLTVAGNPTINIAQQLFAGDTLTIDCGWQTIVYQPSGQSVGTPYPQVLSTGSTFFSLPPGTSTIAFNSSDGTHAAGTLAVWNTSAYDALL